LINKVLQLEEANKSLGSKTAMLTHLEGKIAQLEESLASVNAELDSKTSSASELENSKVAADSLLAAAQEALNKAREELAGVNSTLDSVTKEVRSSGAFLKTLKLTLREAFSSES
jgi:chromosome segregation ATPase